MIEPYFAVWMQTRETWNRQRRFSSAFQDSWNNMTGIEKFCFLIFSLFSVALLLLSIATSINASFLLYYVACFILFLFISLLSNRLALARDRRIYYQKLDRERKYAKTLYENLADVGLKNIEQVRILKEEAAKTIERKESNKSDWIRYSFDLVILVVLASCVNFVFSLL